MPGEAPRKLHIGDHPQEGDKIWRGVADRHYLLEGTLKHYKLVRRNVTWLIFPGPASCRPMAGAGKVAMVRDTKGCRVATGPRRSMPLPEFHAIRFLLGAFSQVEYRRRSNASCHNATRATASLSSLGKGRRLPSFPGGVVFLGRIAVFPRRPELSASPRSKTVSLE